MRFLRTHCDVRRLARIRSCELSEDRAQPAASGKPWPAWVPARVARDGLSMRSVLLAGLRGLDLERAHLAVDDEVAVVELERARDAVLVHLERDRIDRRLLARLVVGLLLGLVEIADGDRPAREAGERVLAGRGVLRLLRPARCGARSPRATGRSSRPTPSRHRPRSRAASCRRARPRSAAACARSGTPPCRRRTSCPRAWSA